MTFQELEKERMKKISHFTAVIAGLTFFYWFGIAVRIVNTVLIRVMEGAEEPGIIRIPLLNGILYLVILYMAFYMNKRLFWIRERGKTVLLVRKYDALPVDRKKYYSEKMKFALRKWLLLFFWCVLIYFLEMLMYNVVLNWSRFFLEAAAALILMTAVQGLCVLLAATQDWWSRRMGTTAEG